MTFFQTDSFRTRLTETRSLSIEATPSAVLISVGQSEQSVTTTAEMMNDFGRSPSA